MQEFSAGNKNINKDAHQMIRAMSVSCLPRIHICACAIKSKQTATSHLYTFIQSNLLSLCKLHSLFDHTIPICLCDHHPNEMSSHTFKINFTLSGHEHSKQRNMTSWVKINSKKYIICNIYIHTTRHIYHNIKNILTIKHDQTLPYFLFSKLCRDRDHK